MVNDTINLMMQHTSVRNFTDEKISVDILKTIIEAGRAASTWKNFQSYSIINISSEVTKQKIYDHALHRPKTLLNDRKYQYG